MKRPVGCEEPLSKRARRSSSVTRAARFAGLILLLVVAPSTHSLDAGTVSAPSAVQIGRVTLGPNQLAAANWYRPGGHPINGHITESFADPRLWPRLRRLLQSNHAFLEVNAAEIGFMQFEDIAALHRDGIGLSVDPPAWSQCKDGTALARAELFGEPVGNQNIFAETFRIGPDPARMDLVGHGWFFTKDGVDVEPDEIVLDHRIERLLPTYDIDKLTDANMSWEDRKIAARRDPCPITKTTNSADRVERLISDYVAYARVMQERFTRPPRLSFHWNVNAGYEWRDEAWLDQLYARHPDPASFRRAYMYVEGPLYRDTAILAQLVDRLCHEATCPSVVYMDVDSTFNTGYAMHVLTRNRAVLEAKGITFGIDLADECNDKPRCYMEAVSERLMFRTEDSSQTTENMLTQISILNKLGFYIDHGLINGRTALRIQSWTTRPFETGNQISEDIPGSFANTALRVLEQYLVRRGWAHGG